MFDKINKILNFIFNSNNQILSILFAIISLSIIISIINFFLSRVVFFILLYFKKNKNLEELAVIKNTFFFFRFILFWIFVLLIILAVYYRNPNLYPLSISNYKMFLFLCFIKGFITLQHIYWTYIWAEAHIREEEIKEKEKTRLEQSKNNEQQLKTKVEDKKKK
jgi:hypothetical protein